MYRAIAFLNVYLIITILDYYTGEGKDTIRGSINSLKYSYDRKPDLAFLLKSLGRLWLAGVDIDWAEFYTHERPASVPLPAYLF